MNNCATDHPPGRHREIPLAQIDGYPELAAVATVWRAATIGAVLPQRIDPLAIPRRLLPGAILFDVEPDGIGDAVRLRVRLAGTMLCDLCNGELKGKTIDQILSPEDAAAVTVDARAATVEGRAILVRRAGIRFGETELDYIALLLPLTGSDGRTTRLLALPDPTTIRRRRRSDAA